METTGVLIANPVCTDIKGKNKWEFVLEIPGKYPVKVAFTAWADKGDPLANCSAGQELTVKANVESREYNSKWYTDVKAWSITVVGTGASTGGRQEPVPTPKPAPVPVAAGDDPNDLPF